MTAQIRRWAASRSLVGAILEDSELVSAVQTLDPAMLGQLVHAVGLEDSGDLLALATTEQLRSLADDDLWRTDAGGAADQLDAERFAVWVEVLLDAGRDTLADALSALDEDLLAHALAQHMIVLDTDRLAVALAPDRPGEGSGDHELAEKLLEASLSHELDELLLLSIRDRGWDALIEAIHELDRRDSELVRRLLGRMCDASMSRVADEGLYTVLSEAETLAEDARGARDDRRERRGFVAAADARAFLSAAREHPDRAAADPVTRSYFRNYEPAPPSGVAPSRLAALLRERGVEPARPALPAASSSASPTRLELSELRDTDPARHAERVTELVYLANVLAAGRTLDGEPINQVDAIDAVLTFADAGLDAAGVGSAERPGLVERFARGWSRAHAGDDGDAGAAARALVSRLTR